MNNAETIGSGGNPTLRDFHDCLLNSDPRQRSEYVRSKLARFFAVNGHAARTTPSPCSPSPVWHHVNGLSAFPTRKYRLPSPQTSRPLGSHFRRPKYPMVGFSGKSLLQRSCARIRAVDSNHHVWVQVRCSTLSRFHHFPQIRPTQRLSLEHDLVSGLWVIFHLHAEPTTFKMP